MLMSPKPGSLAWICLLLSCNLMPPATSPIPADEALSHHILASAKKATHKVPVATIAPFEWDTLYLFHPYMHPAEVREIGSRLGSWAAQHAEALKTNRSFTWLAFVKNGQVVKVAAFPRGGDYVFDREEEGYEVLPGRQAFITSELIYTGGNSRTSYALKLHAQAP